MCCSMFYSKVCIRFRNRKQPIYNTNGRHNVTFVIWLTLQTEETLPRTSRLQGHGFKRRSEGPHTFFDLPKRSVALALHACKWCYAWWWRASPQLSRTVLSKLASSPVGFFTFGSSSKLGAWIWWYFSSRYFKSVRPVVYSFFSLEAIDT